MDVSREDIFNLFLKRWADDSTLVRAIADAAGFHVSLEGRVLLDPTGRISIFSEAASGATDSVHFDFSDVVGGMYADPREASPEERASLESQLVCGIELLLLSLERIVVYELPPKA